MTKTFNYGQWTVTLEKRDAETVKIYACGTWLATTGLLYPSLNEWRCVYDTPELLPQGLRNKIFDKSLQMI